MPTHPHPADPYLLVDYDALLGWAWSVLKREIDATSAQMVLAKNLTYGELYGGGTRKVGESALRREAAIRGMQQMDFARLESRIIAQLGGTY